MLQKKRNGRADSFSSLSCKGTHIWMHVSSISWEGTLPLCFFFQAHPLPFFSSLSVWMCLSRELRIFVIFSDCEMPWLEGLWSSFIQQLKWWNKCKNRNDIYIDIIVDKKWNVKSDSLNRHGVDKLNLLKVQCTFRKMKSLSNLLLLSLLSILKSASSVRIHYIHWNSSSPIFRDPSSSHVIEIRGGRRDQPWDYEQVYFWLYINSYVEGIFSQI